MPVEAQPLPHHAPGDLRHGAAVELTEGGERRLTADWLGELVQAEIVAILDRLGPNGFHRGRYASAARIVQEVIAGADDASKKVDEFSDVRRVSEEQRW
mgnify:CR=1 FL=1